MEYKYYKEVTGELVRVHIEQDTTPENPRYDWDGNIGHMMCWHRNYQLGDYKDQISSIYRQFGSDYGTQRESTRH